MDTDKIQLIIRQTIDSLPLEKEPKGLYSPIRYTLEGGGKRLRPLLLLASVAAFGADPERFSSQAAGIEMFHNFTLLHDDVMDNADVRRGRPTVHRKWDLSTAILSGDAMLTLASQLMMENLRSEAAVEVLRLFNTTAMEIYEGQQYDMDFERRDDVTVAEYMEMIRLKTSVLLGCAAKIGAIVAGASPDDASRLYEYGVKLGLAFQLQDDWLDTFGDPVIFGKAIGGDILNDKKTWLLINALQAPDADLLRSILADRALRPDEKIERVKAFYISHNLGARCHELIGTYADEAVSAVESVSGIDPFWKNFFIDIARSSATRNH